VSCTEHSNNVALAICLTSLNHGTHYRWSRI